ncbi:MAG: hypothetical protein EBT05_19135, partial [Betaproteobacteria bacterium]|nr:hypothetical protein [Betaproteobacteria bacterium]
MTITGNSTVNGPFALGLGGGTITHNSTSQDNNIGVANVDLLLPGLGARTLTLAGADNRSKTFRFNIGDNGGPTNLVVTGSGDGNVITLSGSNTYTGTTTITRGILRLGSAGALPGGLGGTTLSTANTGGGNLVFAATGILPTNQRAVLELNATSGDFYRAVGTGFDQVSWTGHGGFSVSDGTVRTVDLGGSGAQLTWGSGGFVPAGSALQFGQSASNVGFNGTVDFKNDIALGGAVRTIDVANGALAQDAILSGNITATAGGALTKQGLGALRLNGTNNTGAFTVNVTGGMLYFEDPSAVLGASGTITVTATSTVPAAIGLGGSTNPITDLGSRLASASNGAFALDVNSSDSLDFSTGNVTNMRLAAFNPANTAVYYTGTITPSSATYRFGGIQSGTGANSPSTTLVLNKQNALTGASSVNLAPGNLTL